MEMKNKQFGDGPLSVPNRIIYIYIYIYIHLYIHIYTHIYIYIYIHKDSKS